MKKTWLLTLAAAAMILPLAAPAQAQPDYGRVDRGRVDNGRVDSDRYRDNDRDRGRDNDRRDDRGRNDNRRGDWQDNKGVWHRYGEWQDNKGRWQTSRGRWQRDANWRNWSRYDYNRPDSDGYYYADRYYRAGSYRPVVVTRQTRIYRGSDNRYYCRRSDGTTGLIAGAAIGGAIGNSLDRGRSNVLGTLLGAAAGAALGQSIDRGSVTCR